MSKKRVVFLSISILLGLGLLLGRLMQIQLFQTEHFSKHEVNLYEESVKQRTQQVLIDDGRGLFLDSKGKPLSHREEMVLVLFPFLKGIEWDEKGVAEILQVSPYQLTAKITEAKSPFIYGELTELQANKINELNIPGVIPLKRTWIPDSLPAAQIIGVIGENNGELKDRYPDKNMSDLKIGITGLQAQFDEFLLPDTPTKLIFHVDAIGNPLFGVDVKYTGENNPYYPLNVKTTINRTLQEKMEAILEEHQVENGGAILLDIELGAIIANASRPALNGQRPFDDKGAINQMFEAHIPGSVFKTVVATAAIEERLISNSDHFNCDLDIRGNIASRSLGELNLEDSFARSCNRTFAELANKIQDKDPHLLQNYAEKLGLIGSQSWEGDVFYLQDFKQFNASTGRIFLQEDNQVDHNFISQTGIGQHEVRVSPLGVANMLATIARGGQGKAIRVATEIQYADGSTMFEFPEQDKRKQSISTAAAQKMQQLLRRVVTDPEGTGAYFQTLPYEVAGKSGTAQTGIESEGQQLYNKWFAGYFPFESPKYSLVTVNLGVKEDDGSVTNLFADLVEMVHEEEQ
ncbi:peptidoglycan D,D-transpeptidase FtsI family protein [Lederbergia galactosidilytica]|uniref:Penicillin-binding protein n=1 Tax=Lederbergia galactosidilytica TaxID=217031 RepID=A0A178A1T1_9BACI|nr:penicillin-binding transpeptidase domain-containing protein [Lederbergia galactosidilytica]MBP1914862.1 cell division protein FtsI/penicillin-binding protein 2 [Lederbergia galactosidilytica]OAK74157.1 penicillin-binding protein [Lederbergia galactosidilytica]